MTADIVSYAQSSQTRKKAKKMERIYLNVVYPFYISFQEAFAKSVCVSFFLLFFLALTHRGAFSAKPAGFTMEFVTYECDVVETPAGLALVAPRILFALILIASTYLVLF